MAVGADGKQCEWEISVVEGEDRVGNISRHLRSHGITQETLREKAKTIVEQLASAVARKAANRELAAEYKRRLFDFISSAHLPFNIVENEELVALVKFLSGGPGLPQGCQCRQGARDGLIESAREKLARCLKGLAGRPVTLAVDSGTVWRRYFTVVAMCPGELPLIVSMAHDESLGVGGGDHGRQTAENIARHIEGIIKGPLSESTVVAIVADNAANMQAAIKMLSTDAVADVKPAQTLSDALLDELLEAFEPVDAAAAAPQAEEAPPKFDGCLLTILPQRCVAHVLQLIVRDILADDVMAPLVRAYDGEKKKSSETEVDTRWNSKYRVLVDLGEAQVGDLGYQRQKA
jgi:hypothetical protein